MRCPRAIPWPAHHLPSLCAGRQEEAEPAPAGGPGATADADAAAAAEHPMKHCAKLEGRPSPPYCMEGDYSTFND